MFWAFQEAHFGVAHLINRMEQHTIGTTIYVQNLTKDSLIPFVPCILFWSWIASICIFIIFRLNIELS